MKREVNDAGVFELEPSAAQALEEALIPDSRFGLTPADMVEQKFRALLCVATIGTRVPSGKA